MGAEPRVDWTHAYSMYILTTRKPELVGLILYQPAFPGKQIRLYTYIFFQIEIYFKELAHPIMGADNQNMYGRLAGRNFRHNFFP